MKIGAFSLRRRLLGWLMVSTAIFAAIAIFDTYREAIYTAEVVSDRVLSGSALAIAERVVVAEDGSLEVDIPYVALEMLTSAAQDRVFYRVDGPNGEFLTGYQLLPVAKEVDGDSPVYLDAEFRNEPIRIATLRRFASTGINSVPFTVTVAETTEARSQLAQAIILRSALRLALMALGAVIIVWIGVTLSLRPLYRLSEAIDQRSPNDLHPIRQRVPVEVENLVHTVNSFMVRLESALNALRNFTGNASHQLRTPLAIVRTQLALAERADNLSDVKQAAKRGDASIAHAEQILAQLLRMANIDAASSRDAQDLIKLDLLDIAQMVTADHIPAAADAGVDLGFDGDEALLVRAEPLLFKEMLGNLIHNAIAYAGEGAEVTVRVLKIGVTPILEVEDNGPGIAPEKRKIIRQRFARGEGNVQPGAGLGLSIVEEIAGLFKAQLDLLDADSGQGLKARISFPAL
jgi:two-component system sensor histidine kinase TctE